MRYPAWPSTYISRVVRTLPEPDKSKARIGILWHAGATDEFRGARPVYPGTAGRTPAQCHPVLPDDGVLSALPAVGIRFWVR